MVRSHGPHQGQRSSPLAGWARSLGLIAVLAGTTSAPALRAQAPQASPTADAAVQLEGELEVQYEDSTRGARLLHYLRSGQSRTPLRFIGRPPDLLSGSRVRVRGTLRNGALELSGDGTTVQALTSVAPNTFGEQRTIVILVTFDGTMPYTPAAAATTTFGTTSNYYLENSYGQTWLTGDVFGWYPISIDTTQCNTNSIASQAEQAAVTLGGADLSRYTRRIYAFPSLPACAWWGLGSVGGFPSRAWVNGSYALQVVGHELGHNFGNYHSHSLPCDANGCSTIEYGDSHDIMGNRSTGHMSPFQKERLGWLDYGRSPVLQTVTTSGSYSVDAYETGGTLPKALKLLKSVDSSGRRTWYYVEARTRSGFDSTVAPGVIVRTGAESGANTSNQIDLAPTTTTFDAVLDPGQTFTDASINLSLTTSSIGTSGATLNISYDGPACLAAAPTVSVSPGGTLTAAAGSPVNYTLTVANNDGVSCPSTTFAPAAQAPSGWASTFSRTTLDVAAGASASLTYTVTPPAGASGAYSVGAMLSRTNTTGPDGTAATTLNVASSLSVSLSASGSNSQYTLSATVGTGGLAVAGATVAFTVQSPTGGITRLSAVTNSSGVATARLRFKARDPRGAYTVQATASANGLTGTATGSFVR